MSLKTMKVLSGCNETYTGVITSPSPYIFAAREVTAKNTFASNSTAKIVYMVMPLGGVESGLYRSPKVDEFIIAGLDGSSNYYLMGYLPALSGETDPVLDFDTPANMGNIINSEGEVFRYQQTGKVTPGTNEKYSEIGFYKKKTKWKAANKEAYNTTKKVGATANPENYPTIDQINIKSTGDIRSEASNWHLTKAKRMEFLANVDETDHATDKLAVFDATGDDSRLNNGDIQMRAKNRIVLKAGSQIIIDVGRSSIIIDDTGITLTSSKTKDGFVNTWDSSFSVAAEGGLSGAGSHISLESGAGFSLSEGFGGKIESSLGILRIGGVDIRAQTMNAFAYSNLLLANILDFATNLVTLSGSWSKGDWNENMFVGLLPYLKQASSVFNGFFVHEPDPSGGDSLGVLVGFLDTINMGIMAVGKILEVLIPQEYLEEKGGKDGLWGALAVLEYGLYIAAGATLAYASLAGGIWYSSMWLRNKGQLELEAKDLQIFTDQSVVAQTVKAGTPVAVEVKMGNSEIGALSQGRGGLMETIKKEKSDFLTNLTTTITDATKRREFLTNPANLAKGIGGAAVAATVAGVYLGETSKQNAEYAEKVERELEDL